MATTLRPGTAKLRINYTSGAGAQFVAGQVYPIRSEDARHIVLVHPAGPVACFTRREVTTALGIKLRRINARAAARREKVAAPCA